MSPSWRTTLLLDVPMRSARSCEVDLAAASSVRDDDPRYLHGVLLVSDRGRFSYSVPLGSSWLHGVPRASLEPAARASHPLEQIARELRLYAPVVDPDGSLVGLLGWDDVLRFALERGAADPCWEAPAKAATRFGGAITPIAGLAERDLGPLRTVRDVAHALLRVPPALHRTNDAVQYLIGAPGRSDFVTPVDLLRAVFAEPPA